MFFGRSKELKQLNHLYDSDQFEFAVFYGRRRVGKTTLIKEFMQEKSAIYHMAIEGTKKENLRGLSRAVLSYTVSIDAKSHPSFETYELLLEHVDELARSGERVIFAIDEYPYLAESYPQISSMLQKHIDECWKDSKLFLILCGSSMSFMEEQVLGYKSPLYGRRTRQFKIRPFTFYESLDMLQQFDLEEKGILYGITGGIPEYLSRLNMNLSLDENVISLFFDDSGRLFDEPTNLLKQEMKEPASYHSIISAIAGGVSRMNEIAMNTGLESSGCSNQISSLIKLGIVKKECPLTEPNSRKTIYRLEDSMFLFWYRFVRPNVDGIVRGVGESIYYTSVKPQLSDYMGIVFEEMAKQYLYRSDIYPKLPFPIENLGRWWGNNKVLKRQEEIDLMSVSGKSALFAACKWRNALQGRDVLDKLIQRGEIFFYEDKYYYLFSKSGFEDGLKKYVADKENIKLISLKDMG